MQEAWIQLECADCEKRWEGNPADLPAPDETFACDGCGAARPMREFARTTRDLEILQTFSVA